MLTQFVRSRRERKQVLAQLTGRGLPAMAMAYYLGFALGVGLTGVARWTEDGIAWDVTGMAGAFGAGLLYGLVAALLFFSVAWLTEKKRAGAFESSALPFWLGVVAGLVLGVTSRVGGPDDEETMAWLLFLGGSIAGVVGALAWAVLVPRLLPGPDPDAERLARMAPGSIRVKPRREWRLRGAREELRRPAFGDVMIRFGVAFALVYFLVGIAAMVLMSSVMGLDLESDAAASAPRGGFLGGLMFAVVPALVFWMTTRFALERRPLLRDLPRRGPELSGAAMGAVPVCTWLVLVVTDPPATGAWIAMAAVTLLVTPACAWLWVRGSTRVVT